MDELKKKLGIIISSSRKKMNMSQEELAYITNLHRTYISDIERGKRNISIDNLVKIASSLHKPLSDLIKEAEQFEIK